MTSDVRGALRILMLNNEFPPLGGGTGVVNQRILEKWAQREEVEVDVVTSSRTRDQYEYEELAPGIRIHKVPVDNKNIHHSSNRELLAYAWRAWRHARKLVKCAGYDLCLAWAGVPAGGVAMWLKWEFGLPFVVSLQGPDVPGFEQRYRWVYLVLTPFIRLVWRQAAGLTACSEQHRELAQQTEPYLPIEAIPNGVDTSVFHPDPTTQRENEAVRLVCSGRLIERKGQQHLIPAVAELKERGLDVELLIVGTGDNELTLRRQVEELGLEDTVRFTGFVEWEKMPQVYQTSDIFVLPSYNEGMSIALLEAMATGLPVIITNTGGAHELVDGNGVVVPWGSVEALADSLVSLITSAAERQQMGCRSRELALRFTWDQVADRYLDLCKHIVGSQL
jgi:phosphatidylinositol alpha-1,6-mannosyltransferase